MASHNDVIVWEWFDEYHRWRPYSAEVSNQMDDAHEAGAPQLNLGSADPRMTYYDVDFTRNVQKRKWTGTERQIRRRTYPDNGAVAKNCFWQWEGDIPGTFNQYDFEVTEILEAHYTSYSKHKKLRKLDLSTQPCRLPYIIDFKRMTQTRSETKRVRKIERITQSPAVPYRRVKETKSSGLSTGSLRSKSASLAGAKSDGGLAKLRHTVSTPRTAAGTTFHGNSGIASGGAVSWRRTPVTGSSAAAMGSTFGTTMPPMSGPVTRSSRKQASSQYNVMALPQSTASLTQLAKPLPPGWHPPMAIPGAPTTNAATATKASRKKKIKRVRPQLPAMGSFSNAASQGAPRAGSGAIPKKPKTASVSQAFNHVIHRYAAIIKDPPKNEDCCICMMELTESSGHDDQCSAIVKLQCSHLLHKSCLQAMYESGTQDGSIQCPTCKAIFGVKYGNCPAGEMTYNKSSQSSIPGFPDCGLIQIHYNIRPGVQGPEHPNPGERYVTQGFPRIGYLPDNEEGQQILRLLIKAWQRRLTFTIGTSVTTGLTNAVVWNEIHHKTEIANHSGHGYPDNNYFSNVRMEMASQGVVDSTDEEDSEDDEVESARADPESSEDEDL